jgi:membrane protein implicated in regulation of membrane protease activity
MVDPSILIVIFGFYGEIFNNTKSKLPSVLFLALVFILIFYYWPLLKKAKKDVQTDAEVKSERKHTPWIIRIWQKNK